MTHGALTEDAVIAALGPEPGLGVPLRIVPLAVTVESLALQWARQEDAPEGATVLADHELSGRVRRAIPWVSVPGRQLAMAVVLRPGLPPAGEGLLWLLASVAAGEGLAAATGLDVSLKWPNDLLVGDRRLGGVRVDAHLGPGAIEVAVVTVRVNVGDVTGELPPDHEGVTSLQAEGVDVARPDLAAAVLDRLSDRYAASVPDLLGAYRDRCATLGRRVHAYLAPTGEAMGVARDVSPSGALLIDTASGEGGVTVDRLARLEVGGAEPPRSG